MYVLKFYMNKKILDVKHYEHFENALADIINKRSIFDDIPEEIMESLEDNPKMYYGSVDEKNNLADDFEFRYVNGLIIYVGTVLTEESKNKIE